MAGKSTLVDAFLRQSDVFRSNEEVVDCVMDSNDLEDFLSPLVLFVDFIDEENRFQPDFQCLAQHEPGLRHGAFTGVRY